MFFVFLLLKEVGFRIHHTLRFVWVFLFEKVNSQYWPQDGL